MPPIGYVKDRETENQIRKKMSDYLSLHDGPVFTLDEYVLLFGYYMRLFGVDELCHIAKLETVYKKVRITYKLTSLKKDDCIRAVRLAKEDEGSRVFYYLTKKGYARIQEYLPDGEVFIPYTHIDRPKQYIHDYSTGMNFLGFFHSSYPFRYYHETSFSSGGQILPKTEQGVSADALAVLTIPSGKQVFYIEQDMGTERQWKLADKVSTYLSNRLLNEWKTILFSFRMKGLKPKEIPCLSKDSVHSLYSAMESSSFTGPLYKFHISDTHGEGYVCRECRTSFLRYYPDGNMLTKEDIEKHLFCLFEKEKDEEFLSTVSLIITKRHEHFAFQRIFHMWEYYYNCLTGKEGMTKELRYFLSGGSVYGCATPSVQKYLPLIMWERGSRIITSFEKGALFRYFPEKTLRYKGRVTIENTQTFAYDWLSAVPLTLPHVYTYEKDEKECIVAVESLSCDIGSFIRTNYMVKHLVRTERVCMILIATDMEVIKKFCELTQYYMFSASKIPHNNIFLCFHLLGEENLFVLHKDGYRLNLPV